jgi:hypothetical protein
VQGLQAQRAPQGVVHTDYLLELYQEFSEFCPKAPTTYNPKPDKRTGRVYSTIRFTTYSLPCFNELYKLFYLNGVKIVPANIGKLLTPLGLAFWISDDGDFNKKSQRVALNTQGFTKEEVNLLAKTLNDNWDLECVVYSNSGGFIISIPKKSLPILHKLCEPHIPPMMRYKLGLHKLT